MTNSEQDAERQGERAARARTVAAAAKAPIDRAFDRSGRRPGRPPLDESRQVPPAPMDYHPDALGEGAAAAKSRPALKAIFSAWSLVREAAADRGVPLDRLAVVAQRALEVGLASVDRTSKALEKEVEVLEGRVESIVAPAIPETLAAEVRGYWQDRSTAKRAGNWFGDLHREALRDPRTCSAILGGPCYLSGLDQDQQDQVRLAGTVKHAPKEHEALKQARKALELVTRAGGRAVAELGPRIHGWTKPRSEALGKLQEVGRGS